MCMEDIRIGREVRGTIQMVDLIAAQTNPLIGADPDRVSIVLPAPSGGTNFYNNRPLASNVDGISVTSASAPISLNIRDHGDIVTKEWHVWPITITRLGVIVGRLEKR